MYTLYMYYIVLMNNYMYMYMCIIDSHVHTVHVLLMNNYMYMYMCIIDSHVHTVHVLHCINE